MRWPLSKAVCSEARPTLRPDLASTTRSRHAIRALASYSQRNQPIFSETSAESGAGVQVAP